MYILKRLIEVEKLKRLLLDSDQVKLFDYLPKPTIIPNIVLKNESCKSFSKSKEVDLLYQDNRSEFQRVKDAFEAYKSIQVKEKRSLLDQKIIDMLDPNLVSIFNVQNNMNRSQNNSEVRNFPNQIKQSIIQSRIVTQDLLFSNRNILLCAQNQKKLNTFQMNFDELQQIKTPNSPELLDFSRLVLQNLELNASQYGQIDEIKEGINKQDQQNNQNINDQTQTLDKTEKTFLEEIAQEEKYEMAMQKLEPFENKKLCEMSFTKL